MPPDSDGELRTVGFPLAKLIPDASTLADVRRVVERVHEATIHATALLNLHVRKSLADGTPLDRVFDGNWLIKAFYEVTTGADNDAGLAATAAQHMPASLQKVKRDGLTQLMQANANQLATVGKNNVWMHMNKRLLSHVTRRLALPEAEQKALTKSQRAARRLQMLRVAEDMRRLPEEDLLSDPEYHEFVVTESDRLGIDAAVGDWGDKPFIWHLKAKPHRFLPMLALMSREREAAGGKAMALFPLRRDYVPKHVRFDAKGFGQALQAMRNERLGRDRRLPSKHKDYKEEEDGEITFENTLDHRGVDQAWRLEPGFTTDGVAARLQQRSGTRAEVAAARAKKAAEADRKAESRKRKRDGEAPLATPEKQKKKPEKPQPLAALPKRGIYAIDQIKHLSRLEEQIHVVGMDPGILALITASDMDDAAGKTVLQYTLRQRRRAMRLHQYAEESQRDAPVEVRESVETLATHNSKSANLATFEAYVHARQEGMAANLAYYGELSHRQRRWKTYIKQQQSESQLYKQLAALQTDDRQLVLAYGSWGLVAGRPGMVGNKGNPPCIGVGLMRKLARRFLVVPTPEAFTTKTCRKCMGRCGAHPTFRRRVKDKRNPGEYKDIEVHGLRVCQNESCGSHLKRDGNAAHNIGTQLLRLLRGEGPIRTMTDADFELHQHNLCLACDAE